MKTVNNLSNETSPARWMVVDDTECVLEVTAALLERAGRAEIVRCHSGAEALAAFAAHAGTFALVVTDLDMPEMNGIELCRHLRALAPELPVLLATGSAAMTKDEAHDLGFCGLLAKPFLFGTLLAALKAAGIRTGQPDNEASPNHFDHEAAHVAV
jgi:CheY-like chemotaxis protein